MNEVADRATASGRCDFHKGPSETALTVLAAPTADDPPVQRRACTPCREQRPLVRRGGGMPGCLTPIAHVYRDIPEAGR